MSYSQEKLAKALKLIEELPPSGNWYIAAETGISIQRIEALRLDRLRSLVGRKVLVRFENGIHGTLVLSSVDAVSKRVEFSSGIDSLPSTFDEIRGIEEVK